MRILIVTEDEHNRSLLLQAMERDISKLEVLEAADTATALKQLKRYEPEFLFLDRQLTNSSGLELVECIEQFHLSVQLVLIGENVESALEAFRMRAFYYLLKPIAEEELCYLMKQMEQDRERRAFSTVRKLPIEGTDGISYVSPEKILYVSKNKENKTVSIYTKDRQFISAYTLQELEDKLSPFEFLRVHKSYLINLAYVKGLKPYYNGTYNLYLDGESKEPIPVSRNYVRRLRQRIEV